MKLRLSKKYLLFILTSLLITTIFFIPFFKHTYITVDLNYHLNRIHEIKNGILSRTFPVYIYPYTNFEFGYASPLFYCDLFFLFPAFLYMCGIPLLISYKIFIFVICFLSCLMMMIILDKVFKNNYIICIGTVLYSFSYIRIVDVATRNGTGSILAYAVLPLLMYSLHDYFINNNDCYIMLGISFSLLLVTHIITFVIACIFFAILILFNIKKMNKKKYLTIFKAIILGCLLSAFFLFPFFEQLLSQKFWFQFITNVNGEKYYLESKMTIFEIISDFCFEKESFKYRVGTFTLFSYFILFIILVIKRKVEKKNICLFVATIILIYITSSYFPNHLSHFLYSIQFVWRINMITFFIVLYEICDILNILNFKKVYLVLLMIFTIINVSIKYIYNEANENINLFSTYSELFELHEDWIKDTHNFNGWQIVSGEYLPYTNSYNYYESNKNIIFSNEDTYLFDYERNGTTIVFDSDYQYNEKVYMPLSFYKGYYYQELDENNEVIFEKECFANEYSKRVGIDITSGNHKYKVYYKGTLIQKISLLISISTIFVLLYKIILPKRRYIRN